MKMFFIIPYCFGLEESLINAFVSLGVETDSYIYGIHNQEKSSVVKAIYNVGGVVKTVKKGLDKLGMLNSVLDRSLRKINADVLARVNTFSPDVVFVVKGEILYPSTLEALGKKSKLVSYHWDDPFLQYARSQDATADVRYDNLSKSYSHFALTFVYDESYIERLHQAGAREAIYLMDWFEPEIYRKLSLTDEERTTWGADVAFVGSPYPSRIEILEALKEFNVGVWGPEFRWREQFAKYPFLKNQYRGEAAGSDAVKIYNASSIALNVHDTFQCFSSVNNRTFQILAAGALELVDDRQKLHELFEVGKDLVTFKSPAEAAQHVAFYLANPQQRLAIAESGYNKSRQHSSRERARFMLDLIDKKVFASAPGR